MVAEARLCGGAQGGAARGTHQAVGALAEEKPHAVMAPAHNLREKQIIESQEYSSSAAALASLHIVFLVVHQRGRVCVGVHGLGCIAIDELRLIVVLLQREQQGSNWVIYRACV